MSLSKKKKIPFQSNSLHSAITYLTQVLQGSSEISCLHDQYKNIISSDNLINYLCGDMAVLWRNQQIRRVLSSLLHSKSVTSGIQVIKPQNEKAGWRYKLHFFEIYLSSLDGKENLRYHPLDADVENPVNSASAIRLCNFKKRSSCF